MQALRSNPGFRIYVHEGEFYLFRDRYIGDSVTTPQYGVIASDKSDFTVNWTDCASQARFEDVKPFMPKQYDQYAADRFSNPDTIRAFAGRF